MIGRPAKAVKPKDEYGFLVVQKRGPDYVRPSDQRKTEIQWWCRCTVKHPSLKIVVDPGGYNTPREIQCAFYVACGFHPDPEVEGRYVYGEPS